MSDTSNSTLPNSTLPIEFERRFYAFADVIVRLQRADPAEREKALRTVYGRHLGYILARFAEMASEGDFADWPDEKTSANLESQIASRAKLHLAERQAKQTYK